MKAILLAAGFGTRLRPVTNTTPKCLVPVMGRPLLDYWLRMLIGQGVDEILINTHYLTEQVEQYISQSPWSAKITLVHETELLGTGGTVLNNRCFFADESVIVAHADNLAIFDVQEFIAKFEARPENVELTMMTFVTDTPANCGIVKLDQNGIVQNFYEKTDNPPGNIANAAIYIFSPEVVTFMASQDKRIIDISTEIIPYFLARINTYQNSLYLRDIGSIESLEAAEKEISVFSKAFNT